MNFIDLHHSAGLETPGILKSFYTPIQAATSWAVFRERSRHDPPTKAVADHLFSGSSTFQLATPPSSAPHRRRFGLAAGLRGLALLATAPLSVNTCRRLQVSWRRIRAFPDRHSNVMRLSPGVHALLRHSECKITEVESSNCDSWPGYANCQGVKAAPPAQPNKIRGGNDHGATMRGYREMKQYPAGNLG